MLFLELLTVFLLIVLNGLLAMSELAIVSSRMSRLKAFAEQGVAGSRRAVVLASDPAKFLSTVQIGITLVGVLSGAFSGATLGLRLSDWLVGLGVDQNWAGGLGVGIVVVAITYGSLIVGELVPKQIALRDPERVAVRVAPAMVILARMMSPLVWLLAFSGRGVLMVLGQQGQRDETITEEEIKTLVAEAESTGVIDPGEREMITGILRLGDRSVQALMTPRHEVEVIDLADDPEEINAALSASTHSRLPVHDGDPDTVIGVVQAKDFLEAYIQGKEPVIRDLVRQAPIIPDTADAHDVIATLKGSRIHLGLVHDEYGHFRGVVTTADILESIVGAFQSDEGTIEPAAVRRDDGSLLLSGWMPVDELGDVTGIVVPEDRTYHTLAGFVIDGFGRLPEVSESFDTQGWRFEVVDLDGRRVDKVLATKLAATRRAGS
jgi:putative hemolysin